MEPFDHDQRTLVRSPLDDEDLLSGQFWGELRVFLAVAKAKSFNRAAEVLSTSQPTVSRQVKRLQDLMGSQLFVPTRNGIKLTAKGQALAASLTKLNHSLYSLTNDLKAESKDAEGIVRVSVTDGLNTFFIAPAMSTFSAEHPKIQLHLKSPANVVNLRENQTDLMIGFNPVDAADISFCKLGYLHFIPVVAKPYIQEHGIPKRTDLNSHHFLQSEYYTAKTGLWRPWNDAVEQGSVVHYCDTPMAYGMLVKAGLGVGLLGSYTVLERDAVPLDLDIRISVPLYALALTERLRSRPVRIVFAWLCEMFGPANPWFGQELRLNPVPSRFDTGMKMLFNL